MGCYRPSYPTVNHAPNRGPHERPRSPTRRSLPSQLHKLGAAESPWQFNSSKGDVLLDGRLISTWERNLATLATRYPHKYSKGGTYWQYFDNEDHVLLLIVKRHPLDLSTVNHSLEARVRPAQAKAAGRAASKSALPVNKMTPTSEAQFSAPAPVTSTTKTMSTHTTSKPLPQIITDRSP
jgi:hypothetical protein